jgi:hypothetical protein
LTGTNKVASGTAAGLAIPTGFCGSVSMRGQGHKADEHLLQSERQACNAMLDGAAPMTD